MKLSSKTGYIILISSAVIIFLIIGSFLDVSGGSEKDSANNENTVEKAPDPVISAASYEIVENNDISYGGCRRVGIKIIVPDDSEKQSIDLTLTNIINANKLEWQDITVWAYRNSEKEKVGLIGNTMGMKEYSECD